MRVLIIEDDPSVGAAIQMMLGREGCDAVYAPDADAGMKAFESSRFDLVIVDIFMPGMNGLKTIAEFKNRTPDVPVLAISGFRFRDSMGPGLDFLGMADEAGAAVCLRKPFTSEQLMTAVRASMDPLCSGIRRVATEFRDKDTYDVVEQSLL
jgi:DNA-binding response OmpR family regulator